ncbi:unnamed protein product [Plutella xylostella]|uniref:(diamondback moth) hypothetical protein n=1 Tax=Plutella xylostella TaxID=51655 RepID=A0A8S4G5S2_PLUXY|nr:unnamed protein product [Plutella xylostella]
MLLSVDDISEFVPRRRYQESKGREEYSRHIIR